MKSNDMMDLHDSIFKKVIIDSFNRLITIELDVVTDIMETNSPEIYKPIRKKAVVKFTNYQTAKINLISDLKNEEVILDFNIKDEQSHLNIYIYTSNDSSAEFCCDSYEFILFNQ